MGAKRRRGAWQALWTACLLLLIAYFGILPALQLYFPLKYHETVALHAGNHQLDPLLVTAVMRVESSFDPEAVSIKGARGLMQLMPETAAWAAERMGIAEYSEERLFDPELNLAIGIWYLANLRSLFDGDTVLALAAYNGGRANVLRWLEEEAWSGELETVNDIPFPETRAYVQRVLNTYQWYRRVYAAGPFDPLRFLRDPFERPGSG